MQDSPLKTMIGSNERILWEGKPDKKCFLLESVFNPFLPFALIWGLIDFGFINKALGSASSGMGSFIIPFFLLHLMPVWLYLGGVLFSIRKYRNTNYAVTDRGIYVSGGVFALTCEMKPFAEIAHINIHRGIFDQRLGVGDVISECGHGSLSAPGSAPSASRTSTGISICDIPDYEKVYKLVKNLQTDIYADTMYPNDLRPSSNHGYNTTYGLDEKDWK